MLFVRFLVFLIYFWNWHTIIYKIHPDLKSSKSIPQLPFFKYFQFPPDPVPSPFSVPQLIFIRFLVFLISVRILNYSFYTCRYLHILIYIQSSFSSIPNLLPTPNSFWPRMFYRSGWLRCVVFISIRLCSRFELVWCVWR